MKLALVGYGKVGRVVEEVAGEKGLEVVARFTGARPLRADEATRRTLGRGTALIDFSTPEAVASTVSAAARLSLPLVVGTTGWHDRLGEVRREVEGAGIGLVFAANFSLGINLFYRAAEEAAKLFAAFESFDPYVEEWHHKFKKDQPSGTALELRRTLARHYGGRELPVACLRAGYVPSRHAVGFDAAGESLRLEHQARSRRGFAEGALLAAEWVAGRQGFFEFREVLEDLHPSG